MAERQQGGDKSAVRGGTVTISTKKTEEKRALRQMKMRRGYETPSERRAREKAETVLAAGRAFRKQMNRRSNLGTLASNTPRVELHFDDDRGSLVVQAVKEAIALVEGLSPSDARHLQKTPKVGSVLETAARLSTTPDVIDAGPLFAARVKGNRIKQQLIEEAGNLVRAKDAAELLGISPQALHKRLKSGALIAIRLPNGDLGYPAFQLEAPLVDAIGAVLRILPIEDSMMRLSFMFTALPELGGLAPVKAIRKGKLAKVKIAAGHFGEHGAA